MLDNNDEQKLRNYLKDTLANNDSLVIPKVFSEIPPSLNMDLKRLCEYAQKSGKEIGEVSYVEMLDFIK